MRVLERLAEFFVCIQERPLPLNGIEDVVEVERQLLRNELLVLVLQRCNKRSLREENAAHGNDVSLESHDLAEEIHMLLALEETVFNFTELPGNGVHQREHIIKKLAHELVEQKTRTILEILPLHLLRLIHLLPETIDDGEIPLVEGGNEVLPQKDIHLLFENTPCTLLQVRDVEHEENVVVVLLDFWPLMKTQAVLNIKFMKPVLLLQLKKVLLRRIAVVIPCNVLVGERAHRKAGTDVLPIPRRTH